MSPGLFSADLVGCRVEKPVHEPELPVQQAV
jgi:hypothetical protein